MGYYQKAYPIYNLFLTVAIAGIPTAIARMVAERNAADKPREAYKIFRASFFLLLCTGLVSSGVLLLSAKWLTGSYLSTPKAIYCMLAIAPALFFCPLMSAYRGFFQGRQNMKPTALSQIVEQFFRVAVGLGLAVAFLDRGIEYAAAGASFGATAGGIFGFAAIALVFLANKKKVFAEFAAAEEPAIMSSRNIIREILIIAIPITIGSAVLPIMNTIDMMVVEKRLLAIGYSAEAANSLYGELTGFAQPLINFPQVLTQAVSISMVPLVASAFSRSELVFMRDSIKKGIRYTVFIALPCAIGMSVLSKPILLLLYPGQRQSAADAAPCLAILAISVIFLGLTHALTGILQGVGKQIVPVRNLAIGAVCKVFMTYMLTGIPALNVRGAAFGTLTAYAVAAVLDFIAVIKYTGTSFDYKLTLLKPLAAASVMGVCSYLVYRFASGALGSSLACLLAIPAGGAVYAGLSLAVGAISMEELETIPKFKALLRFMKKIGHRKP